MKEESPSNPGWSREVARLEISRFRGYESLQLVPGKNVVVVGEPRAGRSDLIEALRRVLDPSAVQARPSQWDVYRSVPGTVSETSNAVEAAFPEASIEVSLMELSNEMEQELDAHLDLLNPSTGQLASVGETEEAELGLRVTYRLQFDQSEQRWNHWLEYPKSGNRVSRREREVVRGFTLNNYAPLQIRAEGLLRRIANELDPASLSQTLEQFRAKVDRATSDLAKSQDVQRALDLVARQGPATLLELDGDVPTNSIGLTAEDGSISALLRTVQPTLNLDAGVDFLPLSSHGSTTSAVLSTAEAMAAARADQAIVVADDFGDQLDSASAEYLASRLRRREGQVWISTRRAEVISAFDPSDLLRLTRNSTSRTYFRLPSQPDRKERVRQRSLSSLLAPAMSARTVVLLEGPHDFETYTAIERRRFLFQHEEPLAAYGMRFVPASNSGGEGGKHELPKLARLAADLGFAVRVVLDHDQPGSNDELIESLRESCELIVQLPIRAAVERSIVDGIEPSKLSNALGVLSDDNDLRIAVADVHDDDLPAVCIRALKMKGGLHRNFIELLPNDIVPQLASKLLVRLRGEPADDPLVTLEPL